MEINASTKIKSVRFENPTLALAFEELTGFLKKNPGASLDDTGIEVDFRLEKCRGYSVFANGFKLVFRAPSAIEILYAIYDFSEESLGFCFFEPGRDRFEKKNSVILPEGTLIREKVPLLQRRGMVQEFPFNDDNYRLADWMARNRLNYLITWMKYYDEISPQMKKYYLVRGIEFESGHHNFEYWMPANRYYKDHPEYFAIQNGTRVQPDRAKEGFLFGGQLCASHPAVRKEIAQNMIAYLAEHPELKIVSLIPNDGFGWCECEACGRFYDKNKKGELYCLSEHVYVANRLYHDMVRDVAAQVHRERPDIEFSFGAYINYVEPAPGFKLEQEVSLCFAPYWRCINHPLHDPECPINSRYMKAIGKWEQVKGEGKLDIYEYYMGVNLYCSMPMVHHEDVFAELTALKAMGVEGICTQFHLTHWTAYGLNFYAMAKAAYGEGPDSMEKAMQKIFGENSKEANRFYYEVKRLQKSAGPCHIPYPRSLLRRSQFRDYEKVHELAQNLASSRSNENFPKQLVVWTEYMMRFKKMFDDYSKGVNVSERIKEFLNWMEAQQGSEVFVMRNQQTLFGRWLERIAEGKPWYHYGLEWEDEYIKRHDEMLNRKTWD